ncbi:unnamed protein product [Didymodactylos carnosus]|uniref:Uncharacterized protein n=1 Tax=Didymodactylos carnosus TaxID=1234261 RepID=A0A8S2IDX2_9BILA|nr:unnamed protein product [Didymodactylos carnosus]CAF3739879.1 unnamed protein product [Didymodactylos carnosus]
MRRNHGSAAPVPVFDYIRSAAYRNRQSILPTLPKTLSEIVVPRSLTVTSMNQSFLFCDTPGDNKILGLASVDAVRFLGNKNCSCLHWNADGTFRTAPQLFYQSYSIHTWNDLRMKPMLNVHQLNYAIFRKKRKKPDVDHDIHLGSARQALLSEEIDLEEYQRLCRHFGYNYLEVFKKTRDTDISTDEDEDSED